MSRKCPRCGGVQAFMYGCGWDYDKWVCMEYGCYAEEELDTTSYPKEESPITKITENDKKLLEDIRKDIKE